MLGIVGVQLLVCGDAQNHLVGGEGKPALTTMYFWPLEDGSPLDAVLW